MEEIDMKLTKEEFKAANNNIMTVMENRIMMLAHCDRTTANRIANEILDLEREIKTLKGDSVSKEAFEKMKSKAHRHGYRKGYAKAIEDFSEKAINIVYEENNIDMNQQTRNTVVDIHCKLMDLAKLLKEQNK